MHKVNTIFTGLGLLLVTSLFLSCKKPTPVYGQPIDHTPWTVLLQKHVTADGKVNYPGFLSDSRELDAYLKLLSNNHPDESTWTRDEQMAYWINAYNAFTVKLITDNYPLESIKDIKKGIPFVNSVWDLKFIEIGSQKYDLNNIEHDVLRKQFDDPRIHFAINCASVSCPNLATTAYEAATLEAQLDKAARNFFADPGKNRLTKNHIEISRIFLWFGGDFKRGGRDIIDYIRQYTEVDISPTAKIDYLDYNWGLNE